MEKGFRPVVFNKRGHGNCPITTPKLLSFGDPADFKQTVEFVCCKYPGAKLTAVGESAGAGVLASYLCVEMDNTPLVAAVAVSPGYNATRFFKEFLQPPYDYLLLKSVRNIILQHKDILFQKFDMDHTLAATSVHEILERMYCKIYGYKTGEEYWVKNDPLRWTPTGPATLPTVPMLCINSRDDPMYPGEILPFDNFQECEHLMLAVLDKGGHCGFVEEGTLTHWTDKVAVDYIKSVLEYENSHS